MAVSLSLRPGPPLPVLLLLLGTASEAAVGSLNLAELSDMRYGIEILPRPVLGGQSREEEVVVLSSRFKQKYECRLPAGAVHFQHDGQDEVPAYQGPSVPELLRPLGLGPCLVKTKDWWTYEFCYGRHIQQYHLEESEIKGDILYLGYYQSTFNWEDESAKASKQHRLKRYHSQSYGNGSRCDLSGRPREAEVRFLCDQRAGPDGGSDYIDRVDEPQSCSYVLTVRTPRLCPHPFLRPPPSAAPQPIRCHPALPPAQYGEFMRTQASDSQWQVEEFQHLDMAGSKDAGKTLLEEDPQNTWNTKPTPEGNPPHPDPEPRPEAEPPNPKPLSSLRRNVQIKVIRGPRDLVQFIEELKDIAKKENTAPQPPSKPPPESPPKMAQQEEEKEVEGPEEEEEKEVATAVGEEEQEQQEEEEEEEEEEDVAVSGLDLLGRLQRELEESLLTGVRHQPQPEAGAAAHLERGQDLDGGRQEAEQDAGPEGRAGPAQRARASRALAATLSRLVQKLDADRAASQHGEGEGQGERQGEASPQPPSAPDVPGKIEIKIVRRMGAGGTLEDEAQWLSDEDSRDLKEIFFSILIQGVEEAQQERQRQQQLENNYRRVWGPRGAEGTGDPDEFDF
ncbi:protein OS-9 [Ornithorhynchus anatinus]|uniref:protein OS-9 n=1 Tax=Ornithorhynchus anatinus TaxID=9258 RepID=UPI0010A847FA|nr:protein OS-9 [Ornithorhynchus anatinus]